MFCYYLSLSLSTCSKKANFSMHNFFDSLTGRGLGLVLFRDILYQVVTLGSHPCCLFLCCFLFFLSSDLSPVWRQHWDNISNPSGLCSLQQRSNLCGAGGHKGGTQTPRQSFVLLSVIWCQCSAPQWLEREVSFTLIFSLPCKPRFKNTVRLFEPSQLLPLPLIQMTLGISCVF